MDHAKKLLEDLLRTSEDSLSSEVEAVDELDEQRYQNKSRQLQHGSKKHWNERARPCLHWLAVVIAWFVGVGLMVLAFTWFWVSKSSAEAILVAFGFMFKAVTTGGSALYIEGLVRKNK